MIHNIMEILEVEEITIYLLLVVMILVLAKLIGEKMLKLNEEFIFFLCSLSILIVGLSIAGRLSVSCKMNFDEGFTSSIVLKPVINIAIWFVITMLGIISSIFVSGGKQFWKALTGK